jgi:hypothetical protein
VCRCYAQGSHCNSSLRRGRPTWSSSCICASDVRGRDQLCSLASCKRPHPPPSPPQLLGQRQQQYHSRQWRQWRCRRRARCPIERRRRLARLGWPPHLQQRQGWRRPPVQQRRWRRPQQTRCCCWQRPEKMQRWPPQRGGRALHLNPTGWGTGRGRLRGGCRELRIPSCIDTVVAKESRIRGPPSTEFVNALFFFFCGSLLNVSYNKASEGTNLHPAIIYPPYPHRPTQGLSIHCSYTSQLLTFSLPNLTSHPSEQRR